jgi:hypothetical protein
VDKITDQGFAIKLTQKAPASVKFFWTAQSACFASGAAKGTVIDFN